MFWSWIVFFIKKGCKWFLNALEVRLMLLQCTVRLLHTLVWALNLHGIFVTTMYVYASHFPRLCPSARQCWPQIACTHAVEITRGHITRYTTCLFCCCCTLEQGLDWIQLECTSKSSYEIGHTEAKTKSLQSRKLQGDILVLLYQHTLEQTWDWIQLKCT